MMDRIPRFRRRPKHPTVKTDARPSTAPAPRDHSSASSSSEGAAPPPPLNPHVNAHAPHRRQPERFLKVAALKGLHLRSPGKRARSPTPVSSVSESPPPVLTLDAVADRGGSPVGTSDGSAVGSEVGVGRRDSRKRVKGRAGGGAVDMPAFLSLSDAGEAIPPFRFVTFESLCAWGCADVRDPC